MRSAILTSLQKSLQPNNRSIQEATQELDSISTQEFCPSLMEIIDDQSLSLQVRKSALVQLKLSIQHRWKPHALFKPKKPVHYLSAMEKSFICQHLLRGFMRCESNPCLNKLYKWIVSAVVRNQHKNHMPTKQLLEAIRDSSLNRVLEYLLGVAAAFEISPKSEEFVDFCYAVYPDLWKRISEEGDQKTQYLLTKIFWKSTNGGINPYFISTMEVWMSLILRVVDSFNANQQYTLALSNGQESFFYFHSKKWAVRALFKMLSSELKQQPILMSAWVERYLPSLHESVIKGLSNFAIPKQRYFQLRFLKESFTMTSTDHNIARELQYTLLPELIRAPLDDYSLILKEPIEYLRKTQDECWGYTNVRQAAITLWMTFFKAFYIEQNLQWLIGLTKSTDIQKIQTGLTLLVALGGLKYPNKQEIICNTLTLLGEQLRRGQLLLRVRILELVIEYGSLEMDIQLTTLLLQTLILNINSNQNSLLTLRSVQALNILLSHSLARTLAQPYALVLLQKMLQLLPTNGSEEMMPSLQRFIKYFAPDLSSHILELVGYFSQRFLEFSKEYNDSQRNLEQYDGRLESAAVCCLEVIGVLVEQTSPEQLKQIEGAVVPVFEECFSQNGLEYYEDGLLLLNIYLFRLNNIPTTLLFFYPCVIYRIIGISTTSFSSPPPFLSPNQQQILSHMQSNHTPHLIQKSLPVLRTYINKSQQCLSTNTDFLNTPTRDLLLRLIEELSQTESSGNTYDCVQTLSLWCLVIHVVENVESQELVRQVIQLVYSKDIKRSNKYMQRVGFQMDCVCALREPETMWRIVTANEDIVNTTKLCKMMHEKRRVLVGLGSLISCESVTTNWRVGNLKQNIQLVLEAASGVILQKTGESNKQMPKDQSESQSEDEMDWSEFVEYNYSTRLQSVDGVNFFSEAVTSLCKTVPELFNQLTQQASIRQMMSVLSTNVPHHQ